MQLSVVLYQQYTNLGKIAERECPVDKTLQHTPPAQMNSNQILEAGDDLAKRIIKIVRDRRKYRGDTPEKIILSARLFFLMAEYSRICDEFVGSESIPLEELLEMESYDFDTGLGLVEIEMNPMLASNKIEVKWEKAVAL